MMCLKDDGTGTNFLQYNYITIFLLSLPPWPPKNYNYSESLMNNKLRLVDLNE